MPREDSIWRQAAAWADLQDGAIGYLRRSCWWSELRQSLRYARHNASETVSLALASSFSNANPFKVVAVALGQQDGAHRLGRCWRKRRTPIGCLRLTAVT